MALLHRATLEPSKLELLTGYLASQGYSSGADLTGLSQLGAYRFDDPANEVGIETHLLSGDALPAIHVPVTYRAAPLEGAEQWLVGTMQHSVLGPRWVYNGIGDPAYISAVVHTMLSGGTQAELLVDTPNGLVPREPAVLVKGSGSDLDPNVTVTDFSSGSEGSTSTITVGDLRVTVRHLLDDTALNSTALNNTALDSAAEAHLEGTWPGTSEPVWLASLSSR